MKFELKKSCFFAYLYLTIVNFMYSFVNTNFEINGKLSTTLIGLLMLIMFLGLIDKRYNSRLIFKIIIVLCIGVMSYLFTGETVFLIMLTIALLFTELDYKTGIKIIFIERCLATVVIMILAVVDILPINKVSVFKGGIEAEIVAYGLGFSHPNQLAQVIGMLILLYIGLRNFNMKKRDYVGILFTVCVFYELTKSRTFLILVIFTLFLVTLYKLPFTKKSTIFFLSKVGPLCMFFCACFSIGMSLILHKVSGKMQKILYAINGVLSSRFTHTAHVLENYPIPWFSGITDFDKIETIYGYSTVDNGYIRLLYNFGWIIFIIYIVLYFFAVHRLLKKKEYIYVIIIIIISMWGILENILRSFTINFTVIFLGELIKKSNKNEKY